MRTTRKYCVSVVYLMLTILCCLSSLTTCNKNLITLTCLLLAHYISCYPTTQAPLSLAEYPQYYLVEPQGRGTYAFGYEIDDPETNNVQFRDEEKHPNGTVIGRYGYVTPDGDVFIVSYVADENGYRAKIQPPNRRLRAPRPNSHDIIETGSFFPPYTSANHYLGTSAANDEDEDENFEVGSNLVEYADIEPNRFSIPYTSHSIFQ